MDFDYIVPFAHTVVALRPPTQLAFTGVEHRTQAKTFEGRALASPRAAWCCVGCLPSRHRERARGRADRPHAALGCTPERWLAYLPGAPPRAEQGLRACGLSPVLGPPVSWLAGKVVVP